MGKKLLRLFLSVLYISAFTFGGGYVIISLLQKKFVDDLHWIEADEMLDLVAIAQSCPGAVAVNAAILVGFRVAGPLGAAVAVVGTVLPPLVIIAVISQFYMAFRANPVVAAVLKGMQAGVAAVVADVVCRLGGHVVRGRDVLACCVMLGAFAASYLFGVNVILIILVCALIGGVRTLLRQRKEARP